MARKDETPPEPRQWGWTLCALFACVFLWPAVITFDPGDWPSPHQFPNNEPIVNACGPVGAMLAYWLIWLVGDGAYPLLLFATLAFSTRLIKGRVGHGVQRTIGIVLLMAVTSASVHLVAGPGPNTLPMGPGGVTGYALGELLAASLSRTGTTLVMFLVFFAGLVLATQGWVLKLPSLLRRVGQVSGQAVAAARSAVEPAPKLQPAGAGAPAPSAAAAQAPVAEARPKREEPRLVNHVASPAALKADQPLLPFEEEPDEEEDEDATEPDEAEEVPVAAKPAAPRPVKAPPSRPAPATPRPGPAAPEAATPRSYPRRIGDWQLPPLSLLSVPEHSFTSEQELFVREQAKVLERTLEEFRLDAHVVEIDTGPVITMFELRLGAGVKVSQIVSLSNDIARALKAHAIRVVAPILGKNTVGIEVPNQKKEKVRLRDLMIQAQAKSAKMAVPLYLGKDAGGAPIVTDLTTMPHMLIAGTTGSGKSVCLNAIILSVLMTQRPDEVKMILVDPKMVELNQFKDVPHLMCPIVTDMTRAERILEWAVTKMDERYELLAEAGVKNIAQYNELGADEIYRRFQPSNEQERELIPTRLPYNVIIIDELADLMMTAAREVEHHLSRLAQKSRAVGIHIIVATQRPEAKVVTGLIKSNLPCRIAFRVASRLDSRIVLDQNGGEVLMGQGDMLFLPPGTHKLIRSQGTYLDEKEVEAVLKYLSERAQPEFHPELMNPKTLGGDDDEGLRDPLFDKAVDIIVQTKRGSVSLLQRRLTIGYSRASRLIDQMAAAGLVGPYKGSQAREVLITPEQWAEMRADALDDETVAQDLEETSSTLAGDDSSDA